MENSPIPFSVPIQISTSASEGAFPVSFNVTYKNSLRESHEIVAEDIVTLELRNKVLAGPVNENSNSLLNPGFLTISIAIFILAGMLY